MIEAEEDKRWIVAPSVVGSSPTYHPIIYFSPLVKVRILLIPLYLYYISIASYLNNLYHSVKKTIMESKRTFVDNWMEREDDLFQLLMSDGISNVKLDPKKTYVIEVDQLDPVTDTETGQLKVEKSIYYLNKKPILGRYFCPEKSKNIIYVGYKESASRRSEDISQRLSPVVARKR